MTRGGPTVGVFPYTTRFPAVWLAAGCLVQRKWSKTSGFTVKLAESRLALGLLGRATVRFSLPVRSGVPVAVRTSPLQRGVAVAVAVSGAFRFVWKASVAVPG